MIYNRQHIDLLIMNLKACLAITQFNVSEPEFILVVYVQ